jgi:hypothetical protein
MPAYLPGATDAENAANPSAGRAVTFCPLSGPKGSPLDKGKGTGALSTGIGFGSLVVVGRQNSLDVIDDVFNAGFNYNGIPGKKITAYVAPPPNGHVQTQADASTMLYIGGGRSNADGAPNPYTAGISICGAGNGGSRDAGAGPAFTGFEMKAVGAVADVAPGGVVLAGWVNRSGITVRDGESTFASSTAALAAPA